MKRKKLFFVPGILFLILNASWTSSKTTNSVKINTSESQMAEPPLAWNTFLGGTAKDWGYDIAIDQSGNSYVAGTSDSSWGTPLMAFQDTRDVFVVKLSPDGTLLWQTFLGGMGIDEASGIVIDGSGYVYVAGMSAGTWGAPVNPRNGKPTDAFVAKLDSNGAVCWNTFVGGDLENSGYGIALDGSGNLYVVGNCLAKFDSAGARLWRIPLWGGNSTGLDIAVDATGNPYLTGISYASWGTPISPFQGSIDVFVVKLNSEGALQWNTFLGCAAIDLVHELALDASGNSYVIGSSDEVWGNPVSGFDDTRPAFVAKLNAQGTLVWNTLLGSGSGDHGLGVALDSSGNIYAAGRSWASWGNPLRAFSGMGDVFAAKLNSAGELQWNTFLGGNSTDYAFDIALDGWRNAYVCGSSTEWGNPIRAFGGIQDAFVAKIPPQGNAEIGLSKNDLYFGAMRNGPASPAQKANVIQYGTGIVNWTATAAEDWISASPGTGTGPGPLTVGIARTDLAAGTYLGTVTVSDPNVSSSSDVLTIHFQVYEAAASSPPFGLIDLPLYGAMVFSSIPVSGWVLDDIGLQSVRIYRGTGTGDRALIGEASFVEGARPDVEAIYDEYPQSGRAGWGYMLLTNMLPLGDGLYNLLAYATDLEGNEVLLGERAITVNNAGAIRPFGAIDTPGQGGTAAGNLYFNFGWVLTPPPNSIPIDGSTIRVWVDGMPLGHPSYNHFRGDIATLFPGYANANGAVGVYQLNTTAYSDGVHTIEWSVTDSAGNTDGIGSRYFSIQNAGGTPSPEGTEVKARRTKGGTDSNRQPRHVFRPENGRESIPRDVRTPVFVTKAGGMAEAVLPDRDGSMKIAIPPVTRIAVYLNEADAGETENKMIERGARLRGSVPASPRYEAYQLVLGEDRPLPPGASFDPESGIFYWQPGPGFLGKFEFVFVDTATKTNKPITIVIQ